jgi:uncharacterized protein YceH (UPF0502 family)
MIERRLLGVLVEKAKTTPDTYPLSVNAIVTGSNQKSNRHPVLDLSEDDVTENLPALQQNGLVTRITGGRVERWRHNLYEQWQVDKVELAILTELMLRGPQTEGELRGHASRMEPIEDLDALRNKLRPLAERGLVVLLGELGRRGTQITHGFHAADELENIRQRAGTESSAQEAITQTTSSPRSAERIDALEAALSEAKKEIAELRQEVNELKARIAEILH